MFLLRGGTPHIDFDLSILIDILDVVDGALDGLVEDAKRCPDPDGWGLWDTADGLCGVGFTACQQYITATASYCGLGKNEALPCGPTHDCGDTVVAIINNAANSWKHRDEWISRETETKQQIRTQEGLERIVGDVEGGEYY